MAVFNFKGDYLQKTGLLPTPAAISKATGISKVKVCKILDEGPEWDFTKIIYAGASIKLMNILHQKATAGDAAAIKHFLEMEGFMQEKEEVKPGLQIQISYAKLNKGQEGDS